MSAIRLPAASAACAVLAVAAMLTACNVHDGGGSPGRAGPRTYAEAEVHESACISGLRASLEDLRTSRMDVFFSAALGGLVDCEAASGLAHVPTAEVNRMLAHANGRPANVPIPKPPAELAALAAHPPLDERLPYQRACMAYMRSYLPASVARAGDEPDVAAAFTFNALEQCDADAGFATIEPHVLAAMMQKKHLL